MSAAAETSSNTLLISRTLFYFAWFIEICAVITGLAISALVGLSTYENNLTIAGSGDATNLTNVLIAALPFVMVSIVELAKIPTAQAMYATTHIVWKTLFTFVLIFLAFITFETALNGFERNFRNLNYQVSQLSNEKERLLEEYRVLEDQNARDLKTTRETVLNEFDRQNAVLINKRDTDFAGLLTQESLIETKANNIQADAIRQKIDDFKSQREGIARQRDNEINALQGDLGAKRDQVRAEAQRHKDNLQQQAQREEARLRNLRDEYRTALEDASFFTEGSVRERFEPQIATQQNRLQAANDRFLSFSVTNEVTRLMGSASSEVQTISQSYKPRLDALEQKIEQANNELAKIAGVTQRDVERDRARLNEERQRIQKQYETDLETLQARKDEDLLNVAMREQRIAGNEQRIRELDQKIAEVKTRINEKAKDNQVYRIAKMFDPTAKTVADVNQSIVNTVGKVWFGSLAMVIAVTGIMLALASEVVKDSRNTERTSTRSQNPIVRAVRSLSLAINRKNRNTPKIETRVEIKEIIKEVPVERVVLQDVVKEIIKKEVVHVPIYTNDPNLLRQQDVPR